MKTPFFLFTLVSAVIVLTTCVSPYTGETVIINGIPGEEGTPLVIASDLFTPVEIGIYRTRFLAYDPKYRTPTGYTLWSYCSENEIFQERTVIVRKPSGNLIAGYGLIICAAPRTVKGRTETIFLTIMINNNQQYTVGKVTGASYVPLVNWTTGGGLRKGVGMENTIRVEKDETNPNKYHLFFNGVFEVLFVDEEEPHCEGTGRNGYLVVITPDDLDNKSVEVWFSE